MSKWRENKTNRVVKRKRKDDKLKNMRATEENSKQCSISLGFQSTELISDLLVISRLFTEEEGWFSGYLIRKLMMTQLTAVVTASLKWLMSETKFIN